MDIANDCFDYEKCWSKPKCWSKLKGFDQHKIKNLTIPILISLYYLNMRSHFLALLRHDKDAL